MQVHKFTTVFIQDTNTSHS